MLPFAWHEELKYFIEDEFENKTLIKGTIRKGISSEEMNKKYNEDGFSPVDGKIIEACDQLAAFREVTDSIEQGIESKPLRKAKKDLYENYKRKTIGGKDNCGSLVILTGNNP